MEIRPLGLQIGVEILGVDQGQPRHFRHAGVAYADIHGERRVERDRRRIG